VSSLSRFDLLGVWTHGGDGGELRAEEEEEEQEKKKKKENKKRLVDLLQGGREGGREGERMRHEMDGEFLALLSKKEEEGGGKGPEN